MKQCHISSFCLGVIFFIFFNSSLVIRLPAQENQFRTLHISNWLVIGPIPSRLPGFSGQKNMKGGIFDLSDLLKFRHADLGSWWPGEGDIVTWNQSTRLEWARLDAGSAGLSIHSIGNPDQPEICYLSIYIHAFRYTNAKIRLSGFHLFQAFLNGTKVLEKAQSDGVEEEGKPVRTRLITKEVALETGSHLLLIKMVRDPGCSSPWNINGDIQIPEEWGENDILVTTSNSQVMTLKHLLEGPKVTGVCVSPDGKLAAVSIAEVLPSGSDTETWIELRRTRDGALQQTFRGGTELSHIMWSPVDNRFSYSTVRNGKNILWITDLDEGTTTPILKGIEDLDSHNWSPDGRFIVYSVTEKPDEDRTGLRKLEGMPDRWPWYKERHFLYRVNVMEGTRQRLTAGKLSTDLNGISPDGQRIVFTRTFEDFTERPYSRRGFYLLDLETLQIDSLFSDRWANSAQWSTEGDQLLILGGPSSFGGLGINVNDNVIPNETDQQAYIYDLTEKTVVPITRAFNPSIESAFWSRSENSIYFVTSDRSCRNLYQYDLKDSVLVKLETDVDIVDHFTVSAKKPVSVFIGHGLNDPPKAYAYELKKKKRRLLTDPGFEDYRQVTFGEIEEWAFTNTEGVEIEGYVYYPPDFDASRKYPCIVYYYGGTNPVERSFGGRYPKELYAANGYIVYVMEPSGAVGYGQAFSAKHVNNWGKTVADEIIAGVRKFLDAHPVVNEDRVGCIGASYGGFLTMLVTTRTDLFSAAIARAGISSLSSYWGEG